MAISDVKSGIEGMKSVFNKDCAIGVDAVFQYVITGEEGGNWSVTVKDQTCTVNEGMADSPNVTLTMAAPDYLDLINGRLNGMTAYMTGKLKIGGDLMLSQKLMTMFPAN
ncbi:MAG: SCP2 sterol-binding domain-containing protein [Deltaproteobacteria bacterium]|nr:SCP2 sterol-binding domain-containing protein [Deltaproteobacteria bacterium]